MVRGGTPQPTWTYLYDNYSRQYGMQDAKGRYTTNSFDQFGRQTSVGPAVVESN